MTRPDALGAAIADPASVPVDDIPWVLGELERVKATLWARLQTTAPSNATPPTHGRPDRELVYDVLEVARIVHHSESWVRKRGHTLSGFHQPGGKGTRVWWERAKLEQYAGLSSDT